MARSPSIQKTLEVNKKSRGCRWSKARDAVSREWRPQLCPRAGPRCAAALGLSAGASTRERSREKQVWGQESVGESPK